MRYNVGTILGVLLLLPLLAACGNPSQSQQVWSAEQQQQAREMGMTAAKTLGDSLLSRVKEAMETGGKVHALDFCSTEAQNLTARIQNDLDSELQIKRTTFQYRNPKNAPDVHEEEALRYFMQTMEEQGSLPEDYLQRVSAREYRYYRPLRVGEGCLNCHGDPANFSPEFQRILNDRYPNDRAVGYAEGDFRGVIRVSVPASALQ